MWYGKESLRPKSYKCGYCGEGVAGHLGYFYDDKTPDSPTGCIFLCPNCGQPTYENPQGVLSPGPLEGYEVLHVSDPNVKNLYEEARKCFSTNSYTAVVLCCRKLLMHIAVDNNAEEDKGFTFYAQFLLDSHFVPPKAESWVNFIKEKGNQANHEIKTVEKKEAETILLFSGMLLKNIYEFPEISNQGEETT